MYRSCYSINDMPKLKEKEKVSVPEKREQAPVHKKEERQNGLFDGESFLSRLEKDDIILIIVAIILLADDCEDKLLLVALAFIFLT